MKNKVLFVMTMIVAFVLFVPSVMAAELVTVTTEEQFVTAVKEGKRVDIKTNLAIELEEDLTIVEKVTVGASSGNSISVTIDLNGHTIKLDGSNAQFFVQKKGTLVIDDAEGNGLITNEGATQYNQYPIQILGNCEINGGTLENALPNLTTVYVQNETSTCTLNDGTIINSYTKGGRTVKVNKATFVMNGGKVESKAAGSDGQTPAIEGNNVIMTGGTIEAAGTGIMATASNVEITGGTINAGWFALHTRYATIEPAEGKQVNITAGRAAVIAYSAPSSGKGNKIYGGNFDAPVLMESKYVCDATNVEVYGGLFTHDVSEYVAAGYVANKVTQNDTEMYEVKLNKPVITDEEILEDNEIEMGVAPETQEELEEIFGEEIENNETAKEALLDGKSVNIHVQVEKLEEEDVNEEEIAAIKELVKDQELVKFYDITLVVKVDGVQKDTISEVTNKLKFKVLIPEELLKEKRTFFMYRYHDGEVEKINGEVTEDNYFVFESDKFSTYALAYEDEKTELPPKTGDINIATLIGTILVGMFGLAFILRKRFAKSN